MCNFCMLLIDTPMAFEPALGTRWGLTSDLVLQKSFQFSGVSFKDLCQLSENENQRYEKTL